MVSFQCFIGVHCLPGTDCLFCVERLVGLIALIESPSVSMDYLELLADELAAAI